MPKKITGDFNGDGRRDTLVLRIITGKGKRLVFPKTQDYDSLCAYVGKVKPYIWLKSLDSLIPHFHVNSQGIAFGLSHLRNVGDLNEDGSDELAVVINWADFSSRNSCGIYTLRQGKWKCIGSFGVHDSKVYNDGKKIQLLKKIGKGKIKVLYDATGDGPKIIKLE